MRLKYLDNAKALSYHGGVFFCTNRSYKEYI